MAKFNYTQHKNINLSLKDDHQDSKEKVLDSLLSEHHKESKEEISEKRLSDSHKKDEETLTEKRLNDSKKHRNEKTYDGDITKLEEKRLSEKYINEKEKGKSQKIKSGDKEWWKKKSEDGLKIAQRKKFAKTIGNWNHYIQPITNIMSAQVKMAEETDLYEAINEANEWLKSQNYNVSISEDHVDELSFEQNRILKFLVQIPPRETEANTKKKI